LWLCWWGFSSLLADRNYGIIVQIAASLNSTECFVLQSGSAVFTWHGNQCSLEQQLLATKVAEFLKVNLTTSSFLLSFCTFVLFCFGDFIVSLVVFHHFSAYAKKDG